MSIIDHLTSLIAPHECLGCFAEGSLLCKRCQKQLAVVPSRCHYCHQETIDYRTCQSCMKVSCLTQVFVATTYLGSAKELVRRLKFSGAQAASDPMAAVMRQHIAADWTIVPVPTATSRVRQRGYDQAALLGHRLARGTDCRFANLLHRVGQTHQVGADRATR